MVPIVDYTLVCRIYLIVIYVYFFWLLLNLLDLNLLKYHIHHFLNLNIFTIWFNFRSKRYWNIHFSFFTNVYHSILCYSNILYFLISSISVLIIRNISSISFYDFKLLQAYFRFIWLIWWNWIIIHLALTYTHTLIFIYSIIILRK